MKDVLVVVDMQNDFIDGSLGTREAEAIVGNVIEKVDEYLNAGKMVFFTKDTHEENYLESYEGKHLPVTHCVKNTQGWKIQERILNRIKQHIEQVRVYDKYTFGFTGWDSIPEVEEAESYEICGLCTDVCVVSNALLLRAMYPDKDILLDSRCCAGVTPEKHEAALEVMKSCQIDVV